MKLLVLISISLQISLMLLHGPHVHLKESSQGEQQRYTVTKTAIPPTRQRSGHNRETDPRADLSTIIGTGDIFEKNALLFRHMSLNYLGNGSLLRSVGFSHPAELQVDRAVDALADEHGDEGSVNDGPVGDGRVQRMAQRVAHLGSHAMAARYEESVSPVIGAVLVEIGDGHRAVGELVHEEGLEEALGVVQHPGDHGETRLLRHGLGRGAIDETGLHAENKHDDQGSCIFEHEHLGSSGSIMQTSR